MKHWMYGAVAAAALLAGCGGGGEDAGAPEANSGARQAAAAFDDIVLRAGDPATARDALAAMALDGDGTALIQFGGRSLEGAKATFNDVVITVPGDDEPPISVASMVFEGLEMTGAGASFAQLRLSDVSVSPPDEDGALTVGDIELSNPTPALAAWVASVVNPDVEDAPFPSASELGFDGFSVTSLAFNSEELGDDGVVALGAIEVLGAGGDTVAQTRIKGLNLDFIEPDDQTPIKMQLDEFTISGVDIGFLEAIQAAGDDEDEMAQALLGAVYNDPTNPGYDAFEVSGLAFDIAGVAFALPTLNAFVDRDDQGRVIRNTTRPYTATFSADPDSELGAQVAEPLGLMGYEQLELKAGAVSTIDPDTDRVTFEAGSNYLSLTDGFTLRFGGDISGFSDYGQAVAKLGANGRQDPSALMQAFSLLSFHGLELSLEDDSIVDRAFNLASAQTGQDPSALRAQAQAMLGIAPLMAGDTGLDPAIITELASAVGGFLSEPGTLSIKVQPEQALTAQSFADPSSLTKDTLGFSASVN